MKKIDYERLINDVVIHYQQKVNELNLAIENIDTEMQERGFTTAAEEFLKILHRERKSCYQEIINDLNNIKNQ